MRREDIELMLTYERRQQLLESISDAYKLLLELEKEYIVTVDIVERHSLDNKLKKLKNDIHVLEQQFAEVQAQPENAPTEQPARQLQIFLSCASVDIPKVRQLYQRLQKEGFNLWLDKEDLFPGQDWRREVDKAINRSDIALFCFSPTSARPGSVIQREVRYALDLADEQAEGAIFIIPIMLEECDLPGRLQNVQSISLSRENGYERLLKALRLRASQLNIDIVSARERNL